MTEITGYQLALKLVERHTHAELCEPEQIVYKEKDVIALLVELGLPAPDFKTYAKVYRLWSGKIPNWSGRMPETEGGKPWDV